MEVRGYPLPPELPGRRILILESPPSNGLLDGVSALENQFELTKGDVKKVKVVGSIVFDRVVAYHNAAHFAEDQKKASRDTQQLLWMDN